MFFSVSIYEEGPQKSQLNVTIASLGTAGLVNKSIGLDSLLSVACLMPA